MGSRELLALGIPIINAVRNAASILVGTCPKFHDTATIKALAGGGIAKGYRGRLWRYG